MATSEGADGKKPEDILKLEKAVSNRSTCRATGEKIKKGEWRVGIEAWRAGRNTVTWQRAVPFLKNCRVEECEKGNSGICKLTGHRFKKGETRFLCSTGDKKIYLTIDAAAKIIQPVIDADPDAFSADLIEGLNAIPEDDKQQFEASFAAARREPGEGDENSNDDDSAAAAAADESSAAAGKRKTRGSKKEVKVEKTEKEKPAKRQKTKKEDENGSDTDASEASFQSETSQSSQESKDGEEIQQTPVKEDAAAAEDGEEEEDNKKVASPDGVPEYERQRLAIIARNKERMRELGLQQLSADIMPKKQPKPRTQTKGLAARRKASRDPTEPRRASLRQQGIAANGEMIDQELRNGQVLLNRTYTGPWQVTEDKEPDKPKERHAPDAVPFESENGGKVSDEAFLALLKKHAAPPTPKSKAERGRVELHKLELEEQDVAKVTANGISHIQWHPSTSELILAAGDKSGNVSLWHVDHDSSDSDGDGVLSFTPHYSYVSGLRWVAGSKLLTASYDGSLRCLDPNHSGAFDLAISSEDAEFSAFDCTPDASLALLGDNEGFLRRYDIREKNDISDKTKNKSNSGEQNGKEVEIHNKRINTLHLAPHDDNLFVSSSSDNSFAVWDLRKFGGSAKPKFVANGVHPKTCQSAYFAPDGSNRVVSLSRDDTVQVWQFDGKSSLKSTLSIRHNNNTGRWILPFRATWSPSGDTVIVGNMKRQVDIFSAKTGQLLGGLDSEHMTAISSRAAVHPDLNFLAASTASGRVHVYRG